MESSILPAEGLTLEVMAKPLDLLLLQPLLTGAALLASWIYPSKFQKALSFITQDKASPELISAALKVLLVAGTLYQSNKILTRLVANNFVSDKSWNWQREIVLITGGCSGIGNLIVQLLAKRNVKVVVFDISEPKSPLPPGVSFHQVDITSSEAIHSAAQKIRKEIGNPTVLINNAGIGWNTEIFKQTEKQIRTTFDVNIISHFLLVREFVPDMVQENHGHIVTIVTIASMASFLVHASNVDYACTKAATLAFHEGLAQELKARSKANKIRTTVVHPTWVRTPLIESISQRRDFNEFILEPITVARAVVDQLYKAESAQLILPARLSLMSGVRGWPGWLQEGLRNSVAHVLPSMS